MVEEHLEEVGEDDFDFAAYVQTLNAAEKKDLKKSYPELPDMMFMTEK